MNDTSVFIYFLCFACLAGATFAYMYSMMTSTLRDFKSDKKNKIGTDKLIRNYGIGAQIIKALRVKNMILVTRSPKKVIGLEGFGIRITKQEIIK